MAVLMDSCSVMEGSKNGFQTKLFQNVAPALIEIDGDSCHHIHNPCKKFTKNFNKYLEKPNQDTNNDFRWSKDMQLILQDICKCLDVTYRQLEMLVIAGWFTAYDIP